MEDNFKVNKHLGSYVVYDSRNMDTVCDIWYDESTDVQSSSDANIICDALNIHEETGLTPSQLQQELEKAKELIEMAQNLTAGTSKESFERFDRFMKQSTTFLEG